MLIREILEESVQKFGEVKAVKWLNRKEILERSYSEMMKNVISTRKGLLAEGFEGKHIALIGTSSIEWIESYLGIITGCTTAVPLDAALPCEELIDLINRSDSEALFLSPKHRPYLEAFLANCPKLQKVWMLQEEVEDVPTGTYSISERYWQMNWILQMYRKYMRKKLRKNRLLRMRMQQPKYRFRMIFSQRRSKNL